MESSLEVPRIIMTEANVTQYEAAFEFTDWLTCFEKQKHGVCYPIFAVYEGDETAISK